MAFRRVRGGKPAPLARRKRAAPRASDALWLRKELAEARAQQAATAEILKVIASSPTDVQPVFDAIAKSAQRLIRGRYANVVRRADGMLHLVAYTVTGKAEIASLKKLFPTKLTGQAATGKAVLTGRPAWIVDVETDPAHSPSFRKRARVRGWRSLLAVPMLHKGRSIGAINVTRPEPGEFSHQQIKLLQAFADQVVIAIENVRLFNETKEALERQTATAEILKVISSSPADVQPVLDAIVQSGARLFPPCNASILMRESELIHLRAVAGPSTGNMEEVRALFPIPFEPKHIVAAQAIAERRIVQMPDTESLGDTWPKAMAVARAANYRSLTMVPLVREGQGIGAIALTHPEPGFRMNEKQLALVQTFADQAVIAIENVRLFNETKEALERQTATAEILKVISGSPTDVQPVFESIAERAAILSGAKFANVTTFDGELIHLRAAYGPGSEEHQRLYPMKPGGDAVSARVVRERGPVRIEDVLEDPEYAPKEAARKTGFRSGFGVPMMQKGRVLGAIALARPEPGAIPDKVIRLLQTFADQAVIAIENVRLFNETKEALERQTATAEILKVISQSTTDVQPVLEAIVRSAAKLFPRCNAFVFMRDGGLVRLRAMDGVTVDESLREDLGRVYPVPFDPLVSSSARAMAERRPNACADTEAPDVPEHIRRAGRAARFRSNIVVPLVRDDEGIGTIVLTDPRPGHVLDGKQLALLQTFADQAVIAIENVRLFNETKEALERQTATAEILKVIASSPSDVQPVFDAIAGSALRLIGGVGATVGRAVGDELHLAALTSTDESGNEAVRRLFPISIATSPTMNARTIRERAPLFVGDVEADPDSSEQYREMARIRGFRAVIGTPMMMRDGEVIGSISVTRREPGPFTEHEVNLLKTFADQAVIAIENGRLFNETKEALERQTATAEILRVISRSPDDVQPVLEAVASSAARLCEAKDVIVLLTEGDALRYRVHHGTIAPATALGGTKEISRDWSAGRCAAEGRQLHIHDILAAPDEFPEGSRMGKHAGYRTVLMTPLLRDGVVLGVIGMRRAEVQPFEPRQIELINTFADQAVIAIENVRLFNETKEALEQQTATAEILKVISSSPTDTQPVFDTIVRSGMKLFSGDGVGISIVDGGELRVVAAAGNLAGIATGIRLPISMESASGMAIVERRVVNIRDTEAPDAPPHARDNGRKLNVRSMTQAPMFREGEPVGVIGVTLKDPGGLDDKQLALLKTFADQAVIAIENVRLFKELQSRTDALTKSVGQLTALGEVGQAISSTLDVETVLKTVVSRAVQLTGLDAGVIYEYDPPTGHFELRASQNFDEEGVASLRGADIRKGEGAVGTSVEKREPVQVADTHAPDYPARLRELLDRYGYRALLAVPLLREDNVIGALMMTRKAPGEFQPDVVELLQTFASQSALAIQNARLFREIAEKGKQLEVASRHKSDFLASMSHELRTPLNAILGFNEMLLGQVYGDVPADMREPLEDIQKSGKHLLRLINNVLDLAKIEAGRMELSLSDYSVHDTVESVRATLRPLAAEKGLEFLVTVPPELPLAYGDSGRITQCLMNLAGNSLKFTKAGKVEIAVAEQGELLIFRVADTGIGIPPDKIASLFTEFKQTDATIASEYGGTGLGLSISKKFVEMHGGRIWIESELGKGSTFNFEVPLRVKTP